MITSSSGNESSSSLLLKGNGFSSVWNNKKATVSLKNSIRCSLIFAIDLLGFDANKTKRNWMKDKGIQNG